MRAGWGLLLLLTGCGAEATFVRAEAPFENGRIIGFVVAKGNDRNTSRSTLVDALNEEAQAAGCSRLAALTYSNDGHRPYAAAACVVEVAK
jgi:hypothetical protein